MRTTTLWGPEEAWAADRPGSLWGAEREGAADPVEGLPRPAEGSLTGRRLGEDTGGVPLPDSLRTAARDARRGPRVFDIVIGLLRSNDDDARHRLALCLVWGAALVELYAVTRTAWVTLFFFVIFPLLWMVHRTRRAGLIATLVFAAGITLARAQLPGVSWAQAVTSGVLSAAFSVLMGLWIWHGYTLAIALATSLDNERIAAERLRAAQAELAAAERNAGRLAEHERWSRDVHDTLAQGFVSVIALSQAARGELQQHRLDAVERRLTQAERVARDNLAEARSLVAGEGPTMLRSGDLAGALQRLAEAQTTHGLAVSLSTDLPADLPSATQVVVLRTVQEALSNVVRHSGSATAEVAVTAGASAQGPDLSITVRDDGVGTAGRPEGTGLTGMRSRVESAGGILTVDPAHLPDAHGRTGTVVEASVPL